MHVKDMIICGARDPCFQSGGIWCVMRRWAGFCIQRNPDLIKKPEAAAAVIQGLSVDYLQVHVSYFNRPHWNKFMFCILLSSGAVQCNEEGLRNCVFYTTKLGLFLWYSAVCSMQFIVCNVQCAVCSA